MLKKYTVRLSEDQIKFLKDLKNASEWIREQLNRGITESATKPHEKVILLNRRLIQLENKLESIYDDRQYQKVSSLLASYEENKTWLETAEKLADLKEENLQVKFSNEHANQTVAFDKTNPETQLIIDKKRFVYAFSVLHQNSMSAFLYGIKAKVEEITKQRDEIEKQVAALTKVRQAYELMIKDIEAQISEVKREIETIELYVQLP